MCQFVILVSTSGCDVISSGGTCYKYFTNTSGIDWNVARQECITRGYDLATVTSFEENYLMYNTATNSTICWIGLNDIDDEGTFVWADGTDSTFTYWTPGEPSNSSDDEDCTGTNGVSTWNDFDCVIELTCYFCKTEGKNLVTE